LKVTVVVLNTRDSHSIRLQSGQRQAGFVEHACSTQAFNCQLMTGFTHTQNTKVWRILWRESNPLWTTRFPSDVSK
jgi:hypothetical protein